MNASVAEPQNIQRSPADDEQQSCEMITLLANTAPADCGRDDLRRRTIEAWLPMAQRLARRYAGRGENVDDLQQVAMVGLIKAVDRFDPEQGADFVAFAVPTILGELRRHFRDRAWSVRVPRQVQEMRMAISGANASLSHTLNRLPTVADIAQHLGVDEEAVLEGLEGGRAFRATSLSTPVTGDGTVELIDRLAEEEHGYDLVEIKLALGFALDRLSAREKRVLILRYWGNQTQARIAEQVGVSQMQVSRILGTALARLRRDLDAEPREPATR
jgi:RNA polymerase sigma-B factor